MTHPDDETLTEIGIALGARSLDVLEHVGSCARCRSQIERAAVVAATLQEEVQPAPEVLAAVSRAIGVARSGPAGSATQHPGLRAVPVATNALLAFLSLGLVAVWAGVNVASNPAAAAAVAGAALAIEVVGARGAARRGRG